METAIRMLCGLSVFCGIALELTPEGRVRRVTNILCTVVLILAAVQAVTDFDMNTYALELARLTEREAELRLERDSFSERLNRLVIAGQYETYIMDKAARAELRIESLEIGVQWSTEGFWVPYSLHTRYAGPENVKNQLITEISDELGIPPQRQYWSHDEGLEGKSE